MTEEANVISIDGNDYKESDLSDKQKKVHLAYSRFATKKLTKEKLN